MSKLRTEDMLDDSLASVLWNGHICEATRLEADVLLVLGSNDLDVACVASDLFKQHEFDIIVCTGGIAHENDLLATGWDRSEAEVFAETMRHNGIPAEKILIEPNAANTSQNFLNSKEVLKEHGFVPTTGTIVQKPFMERRAIMTAQKVWPEVDWEVTSKKGSWSQYVQGKDHAKTLSTLVGDTVRLSKYSRLGFQVAYELHEDVKLATFELIARGYVNHLP